ncbi:flagellar assembly protein FliH [Pseudomaricurvus sp.]|uniref:flagellar assembly protein FliH n=1 Tax=Pseudomaricurvus sp. TaxID=2004510 RepID=UPI003F6CFDBD
MIAKLPNLIASEDLQNCNSWNLPEVGRGANILSAETKKRQKLEAERKAQHERERQSQSASQANGTSQAHGELIEDVGDEALSYAPLTADQLQDMADAAEKEGFDLGYGEGVVKGIAEGKKQGYEDGLAQAQEEIREKLTTQVSQLLQVAEALVEPIQQQEDQLQQLLLSYVTTLTEQVIERELVQDSSHILSVVQRAVQALPVGAESIKVILNPDDLALVETYAQDHEKPWLFRGDGDMQPGGCRIESAESLIDFSVESRMKAMFSQFLDKQLVSSDTEEAVPSEPEVFEPEVHQSVMDTPETFGAEFEPSTDKEPSANSQPSADNEPSANNQPLANSQPSSNEPTSENPL